MAITTRRRILPAASLIGLALAATTFLAGPACAAEQEPAEKRVLVLLSDYRGIEWTDRVERRFRIMLRRRYDRPVTVNSEFLDLGRYDGTAYREMLAELIETKYPPDSIDLVVCSGSEAFLFFMRFADRLFPSVPMVFGAGEYRFIYKAMTRWSITGVFRDEDFTGTMRAALGLFPETRRIYLVSGSNAGDLMVAYRARGKLSPFSDQVEIVMWDDLTRDGLLDSAAVLPERSIVLYLGMSRDAAGENHVPREVLHSLIERSGAPVFVLYKNFLAIGGIGGSVCSALEMGEEMAGLAARVLGGESPPAIAVHRLEPELLFNWKELQRWGIDERRLPPGGNIRGKPHSFLRRHRMKIAVVSVFIFLQAILVVALAVNTRRRRLAQDALGESEDRMRVVLDASEAGITLVGPDGTIDFANHRMARMLGHRSRDEILGGDLHSFVYPPDRNEYGRAVARLRKGAVDHVHFERRFMRLEGGYFWAHVSMRVLPGPAEEYRGAVVVVTDITKRKRMEEMTARLEEQVRQSQKMEAVGTLAGGIAHDFNNILTPILGYAEMALDETESGSFAHEDIAEVVKAGKRARALVRQILTFGRQSEADLVPVRIQAVIPEAVDLIRASIPASVEIVYEIDPEVRPVLADPTQIQQIVMNLCINALHAMGDEGGELRIELSEREIGCASEAAEDSLPHGAYARLSVQDTGHGMTREVAGRVFEPYFTTKEQGKGTGLGLSVVHGIVKSSGGDVSIGSEPGKGTVVSVLLPVIEGADETLEQKTESAPLPKGTERIMVVDDEETIVELLRRVLEGLGYAVSGHLDAAEALVAFRADPGAVDLVITDFAMPGMNGTDLAEHLHAERGDLPVILCTGYGELVDDRRLARAGIRVCHSKPIRRRELAECVRAALDSA